jgi:geranylgeranyl reductase family protein
VVCWGGETVKAHTAEVIIVGGGPSGSIAAAQLADKGLDVLILEKDYFPRYKPCAGGVTARALSALGFSLPETIVQEECHVFRAVMGKNVQEARFGHPYAITVDRSELDSFLLQRAKELGAAVHTGEQALAIQPGVNGMLVRTKKAVYRAPLVVGADGIPSMAARVCGRQDLGAAAACLCADVPRPLADESRFQGVLETHWGLFRWGYGWVFPKRDHLSVGLGTWDGRRQNLKALWTDFVKSQGLPTAKPQGHLIPVGGKWRPTVADGLLLVGDAAGFADPLTGEGLYYAFSSANIAGETIWSLKQTGLSYTANNLARYERSCWQLFGQDLKQALRLNKIAQRYPGLWHQAFKASANWFSWALQVVEGEKSYRQMCQWVLPRLLLLWLRNEIIK